jgi:hypothetical protein
MIRILIPLVSLVVLLLANPLSATEKVGDLQFATNFDTLMASTQLSQKLIIIDWFTDW